MARTILRTLVALVGMLLIHAPAVAAQETMPPDEYMELAREILAEIIEINTTNTERGDNTAVARVLERYLLEAGFPEEDVHVLIPDDAPTKGNLVARYRGRDPSLDPILLLAHIDVVEAHPEDWSNNLDPFAFTERDGYWYGRGVTDDKDEAAIHTANFIRMREEEGANLEAELNQLVFPALRSALANKPPKDREVRVDGRSLDLGGVVPHQTLGAIRNLLEHEPVVQTGLRARFPHDHPWLLGVLPREIRRLAEFRNAGAHAAVTDAAELAEVRRGVLGVGQEGLLGRLVRVGMRGR